LLRGVAAFLLHYIPCMHHFYLNRRDGSVFKTSTERIQGGGREPRHSRLLFTKSRAISQQCDHM
jgi:hypothetical protein